MEGGAWWAAVHGVARSRIRPSVFTFTFHFRALEKEMAAQSSVLSWRIPGMAEPDGLPSMGSHRVGHDWSDLAAATAWTDHVLFIRSLVNGHFHFCLLWIVTPWTFGYTSLSVCLFSLFFGVYIGFPLFLKAFWLDIKFGLVGFYSLHVFEILLHCPSFHYFW